MPEKILRSLDGLSETLLMTLYARARESLRPEANSGEDISNNQNAGRSTEVRIPASKAVWYKQVFGIVIISC